MIPITTLISVSVRAILAFFLAPVISPLFSFILDMIANINAGMPVGKNRKTVTIIEGIIQFQIFFFSANSCAFCNEMDIIKWFELSI